MTLKDMIRLFTPPAFIYLADRLRSGGGRGAYELSGDYHSWDEAMAASTGYDASIVLEKTKTALLNVKDGQAAYERDSVLFDEIQYAWPLLAGLLWVAARSDGRLDVLDFGGSLGSTYYQNRAFLRKLRYVKWNIVEQAAHVETGRECCEDERLRFYLSIAECLADTQPNVVILSSVLQYLEHPYEVLDELLALPGTLATIIDRTPFWDGRADRLCVQTVPPSIYDASYPSWVFSRQRFHSHLRADWEVMATFDSPDRLATPVDLLYQGVFIVRANHLS